MQHPESYTLSIDLSGKMTEGTDQNPQGIKYLMVGCYTTPITKDGRSLLPVPGHEHAEQDQPLPGVGEDIEQGEQLLQEEDEPVDEGDDKYFRQAQVHVRNLAHIGCGGTECGSPSNHLCGAREVPSSQECASCPCSHVLSAAEFGIALVSPPQ